MGVMACDRPGCENVMCDVMIDHKYVCGECLLEFNCLVRRECGSCGGAARPPFSTRPYCDISDEPVMSFGEWQRRFHEFMDTTKRVYMVGEGTLEEFLQQYAKRLT